MQRSVTFRSPTAALAMALACTPIPGSAQMAVGVTVGDLGMLTCTVEREEPSEPSADGRVAVCEFHPRKGPPETYSALLRTIRHDNRLPAHAETVMLVVKGPYSMQSRPGMLEQAYGAEDMKLSDKYLPLAGETNAAIVLHVEQKATEPTLALGQQPRPSTLIKAVLKLRSSNT